MNEEILKELKVLNELLSIIAFTLVEKGNAFGESVSGASLRGAFDLIEDIRDRLPNG